MGSPEASPRVSGYSECFSLRFKLESFVTFRNVALYILIPLVTIFIIMSSGGGERQPSWDTGYLDHVDKELFRKALSADAAPLPVNESLSPPKIAFLFLIRGHVPLEALWVRFLEVLFLNIHPH